MYKKLRIVWAIIAALFLVVILPAATFWGLNGLTICGFGAGLFFFLTLIFKKAQYNWEEKHGIPHDIPEDTPKETFDEETQTKNQEENTAPAESADNTETTNATENGEENKNE